MDNTIPIKFSAKFLIDIDKIIKTYIEKQRKTAKTVLKKKKICARFSSTYPKIGKNELEIMNFNLSCTKELSQDVSVFNILYIPRQVDPRFLAPKR